MAARGLSCARLPNAILAAASPPKNDVCGCDERAVARSPALIQLNTPNATAPVVTPIALAMPGRSAVAIVAVRISATVDRHGCHVNFDSVIRSEEHTSELQSLMRISYAVFCLKKKKK